MNRTTVYEREKRARIHEARQTNNAKRKVDNGYDYEKLAEQAATKTSKKLRVGTAYTAVQNPKKPRYTTYKLPGKSKPFNPMKVLGAFYLAKSMSMLGLLKPEPVAA